MSRSEMTAFLSECLERHIDPHNDPRIYWANEVTFDYATGNAIRVDYLKFKPINNTVSGIEKGDFYCYEIKSCVEDFKSKNGHNFIGDYNYYVMPQDVFESVKGLIGQIVDLGVNHIKPLLADIMSFAVNELFPAVSPLISMIISLVGTTLINAIKLVVDVIHGLLPVIEPVIQGIVGLIKGIVSVTITVVNAIIGTLNKVSFTVPDWVPALGGKKFGFNLKEVAMPAFANGGFTHGVSIAGEAGGGYQLQA